MFLRRVESERGARPQPGARSHGGGDETSSSQFGTGLIEVLIATAIVVTALGILAGLASVALRTIMSARDRSLAVVYAHSKFEELLSSAIAPAPSPNDALEHDEAGWSEYLDAAGRVSGRDPTARGTVFVRRWRITPVDARSGLHEMTVSVGRCAAAAAPSTGCVMPGRPVVVTGVRSEFVW